MIYINNYYDTSGLSRLSYRVLSKQGYSPLFADVNDAFDLAKELLTENADTSQVLVNLLNGIDVKFEVPGDSIYILCGVACDSPTQ